MNQTASPNNPTRNRQGRAWIGLVIPLALIAIAAGIYLLIIRAHQEGPPPPDPRPTTLETGKDYYLMARTIELYPKRPGGEKAWDRTDGSGPDIQYSLTWQDNIVFESEKRSDTLVGAWDALSIDVKKAVLQGNVDLASSIAAAIIPVQEDTEVLLKVWDSDVPGSNDAGKTVLKLDKLKPGDTTFTYDPSDQNAIKRIVVRVIDKSLPLRELVDEATKP
ncbi:MAG: hypothetical protein AAF711_11780 [Planctomycetota bacterium]